MKTHPPIRVQEPANGPDVFLASASIEGAVSGHGVVAAVPAVRSGNWPAATPPLDHGQLKSCAGDTSGGPRVALHPVSARAQLGQRGRVQEHLSDDEVDEIFRSGTRLAWFSATAR